MIGDSFFYRKNGHTMKRTELLAPAGDYASLIAAFNAGADAVYLAGKQFGARAFANNFEEAELLQALDYAHLHGKKIYLTLNTLIKESEFSSIVDYLMPYYNNGLDGIIIQDLGLISLLKKEFPLLELHASTQMTINNYRSAKWLKEQGLCRIVPSRELSLIELKEIKEKADIEVEAFIHGAMCYGYSGQCLFSSFLGGRSGNRGRCAQTCRLPYIVNNGEFSPKKNKETYPLSLKDLCSLPYIYELLDLGIDSFKIEGRMKSPEYVAGVTSVYRKYIDMYYEGKRMQIEQKDLNKLSHLYIRSEMKDGYLKKHNGKDMISVDSPSYKGNDERLIASLHEQYCIEPLQLPIIGNITLVIGQPAILTLYYGDTVITSYGEKVEEAQNRPLSKEEVFKQINKTGNSVFFFEELTINMDDGIFMLVKHLNTLRRNALEELQNTILSSVRRRRDVSEITKKQKRTNNTTDRTPALRISVTTIEQLNAVFASFIDVDRIYIPADLFYLKEVDYKDILIKKRIHNTSYFLSLPRIIRRRDDEYLKFIEHISEFFDGILVKNLESLCFLQSIGYKGLIVTDSSIYNWNREALSYLNNFRDEYTYPLELTLHEIKDLHDSDGEYVVYGRTPMMVSANCIRKTTDTCTHNINGFSQSLTDRYHKVLPVYTNCIHCYNEIYNAVSMSCHKEMPQLLKNHFYKFRLNFTNEDADTTCRIAEYYNSKLYEPDKDVAFPLKEYTLGHFKEGAL